MTCVPECLRLEGSDATELSCEKAHAASVPWQKHGEHVAPEMASRAKSRSGEGRALLQIVDAHEGRTSAW